MRVEQNTRNPRTEASKTVCRLESYSRDLNQGGAAGAAALLQHLSLLQPRAPCSKGPDQGDRSLLEGPPSSSNACHRRSTSTALEPSPATPTPSDRDRRSFNCAQQAKCVY